MILWMEPQCSDSSSMLGGKMFFLVARRLCVCVCSAKLECVPWNMSLICCCCFRYIPHHRWILRSVWLNVNYDTAQWRHFFLWHRHCVGVRPQHLTVLYIYIYIYIIYIWTSINEYEYIIVVQPLRDSIHKNKMSPAKIWQTTILRQLYEWMKGSPVPVYPWPLRYRTTTTTVHIYDIRVYIHTSISLGYIYINTFINII